MMLMRVRLSLSSVKSSSRSVASRLVFGSHTHVDKNKFTSYAGAGIDAD